MSRLHGLVSKNRWTKVVTDACAVILSYLVALSIRFELAIPMKYLGNILLALPGIVLIFLAANYLMHIYAGRWKYASFDELLNLSSAAIIATAVTLAGILLVPGARNAVPVSVAVIGGVLSLFVMAFARLQFRLFFERGLRLREPGHKKVLLIGAGDAGEMVVRDMLRHPEYDYHPVGFIDDDLAKSNLVVQGVPVLGSRKDIPKIARKQEIDEIFITIPSGAGEKIREILPYCEETGAGGYTPSDFPLARLNALQLEHALRQARGEQATGRGDLTVTIFPSARVGLAPGLSAVALPPARRR